jgi:hypothetical protein
LVKGDLLAVEATADLDRQRAWNIGGGELEHRLAAVGGALAKEHCATVRRRDENAPRAGGLGFDGDAVPVAA